MCAGTPGGISEGNSKRSFGGHPGGVFGKNPRRNLGSALDEFV